MTADAGAHVTTHRRHGKLGRRLGTVAALVAAAVGAALAGLAATLGVAAVTTVPAAFLAAGVVAALAVWLAAVRLATRRRGRRVRVGLAVAGILAVALALTAALVPLGDPVRAPAAPPGAGTWTLPDGGRLAYGVLRAAPGTDPATPVVVLHGGPGVPDLAGQLAALRPLTLDGRDVWAYAQRGAGASSRLADPRGYTTELAVADLEWVRTRIGADRLVLVGHSYGAYLAAAYTAAHPDRVERLVFSSPGDLRQGGLGGRPQERLDGDDLLRLYRLLAPPRALLAYALVQVNPAAAHAFAGDRELDARQDRIAAATLPALHCPGYAARPLHGLGFYANQVPQSVSAPAPPDVATRLAGSPVPVLVLKPQCDYLDWRSATVYLDVFPNSRLSYLTGAGHDAYLEQPDRFAAAVREFLRDRPVPGTLTDPYQPPADFQPDTP